MPCGPSSASARMTKRRRSSSPAAVVSSSRWDPEPDGARDLHQGGTLMRWATFQIPPATTERIGVVRGDEIHAMAAGPRLIDLLGDGGERLAAAGAKTLASPAEGVRGDRGRLLPPISRPPAGRGFLTFRPPHETILKAPGRQGPPQFFRVP